MTQTQKTLHVRPRYYRIYTNPGVEVAERNYAFAHLDWRIPLDRAALVLVDVWNYHFASDTWARMEEVMKQCLVPLVEASRRHGLQIIHAPAPEVAEGHPNQYKPGTPPFPAPHDAGWPPTDFRRRAGEWSPFAWPREPQDEDRRHMRENLRDFHPSVIPTATEPVVANGEELHHLCKERGLLFLLYAGFNTNACVTGRDYGIPAMRGRGYAPILVRDATTGMETHETMKDTLLTRATILNLEQFGTPTLTAGEIIEALSAEVQP